MFLNLVSKRVDSWLCLPTQVDWDEIEQKNLKNLDWIVDKVCGLIWIDQRMDVADVGEVCGCGCYQKSKFGFGLGWAWMDKVGMAETGDFVKFKFDDAEFAGEELELRRFGVGSGFEGNDLFEMNWSGI
ncbi:hypothetical protein U1Q18_030737 [Sarracenia purpurea var. burkii]